MFICNHCPYVKAIIKDIVEDCKNLEKLGVKAVAISANDPINYPEDSFDNMIEFSKNINLIFRIYLMKLKMLQKVTLQFVHLIFLDTIII